MLRKSIVTGLAIAFGMTLSASAVNAETVRYDLRGDGTDSGPLTLAEENDIHGSTSFSLVRSGLTANFEALNSDEVDPPESLFYLRTVGIGIDTEGNINGEENGETIDDFVDWTEFVKISFDKPVFLKELSFPGGGFVAITGDEVAQFSIDGGPLMNITPSDLVNTATNGMIYNFDPWTRLDPGESLYVGAQIGTSTEYNLRDVAVTVVPLPPAALAGVALLGGVVLRRRRWGKA